MPKVIINQNNNTYLSIVIPAYDEEPNIVSTLQDVAQYLKTKNYTYEIIIVDDGSNDKTAELASSCGYLFNAFTLLRNPSNKGKGYSVQKGILKAVGEFILFMDADNSTRINQIDGLFNAIFDGNDIAIASRRIPGAKIEEYQPIHRIIMGNTYIFLSKIILGTSVKDYNCGFKLFKKETAKLLFSQTKRDDWSFDSEFIYLASRFKFKIKEVPTIWQDKKKTSKVKPLRDGIKSLISLLKIRFTKYPSTR